MELKTISSEITTRIVNEQDLLNVYNISLDEWEIEKKVINTWESGAKNDKGEIVITPLFQVKLWLKSKQEIKDLEQIRQEFIEDIKKLSPVVKAKHSQNIAKDPVVVEIDIFDLHLGKISWSNDEKHLYNTDIASKLFTECIDYFIENTKHLNIEKFILPIGSDYFQYDISYPFNSTTKGTPQSTDGINWMDLFRRGRQLLIENIDKLSEIAPVDVIVISGNHDLTKMYYLGDSLSSWYHNNENVTIDNGNSPRKYYQYGVNLLGFTHGSEERINDLALIMASEVPMEWAITKVREFHLGHTHTKSVKNFQPVKEINGVVIRNMSSLSQADDWHMSKGYVCNRRAAECYVWDKQRGNTCIFNYII